MPICNLATASVGPANLIDTLLGGSSTQATISGNISATANLSAIWSLPVASETNAFALNTKATINLPVKVNSVDCQLALVRPSLPLFVGASPSSVTTSLSVNAPNLALNGLACAASSMSTNLAVNAKAYLLTAAQTANCTSSVSAAALNLQTALNTQFVCTLSTSAGLSSFEYLTAPSISAGATADAALGRYLAHQGIALTSAASILSDLTDNGYLYAPAVTGKLTTSAFGSGIFALSSYAVNCTNATSANLNLSFKAPNVSLALTTAQPSITGTIGLFSTVAAVCNVGAANVLSGWTANTISCGLSINAPVANYATLALASSFAKASVDSTLTANSAATGLLRSVTGAITNISNTPAVGSLFTAFRGLTSNSNTAALAFGNTVLEKLYYFIYCEGAAAAQLACSASRLNILLKPDSISALSAVSPIAPSDIFIGKTYQLSAFYISPVAATANADLALRVGHSGAIASTLGISANIVGGMRGAIAATSSLQTTADLNVRRKLTANEVNSALSFDTSNTRITKTHYLTGSIQLQNTAASYYEIVYRKLSAFSLGCTLTTFGGAGYPNGARLTLLGGTLGLGAVTVTPSIQVSGATLLSLGSADFPQQLQEYSKYSLPTGTSLATPLDEDGNTIFASGSVFGATLLRVNPGANSLASVSARVKAVQLGPSTQYSTGPDYTNTLVFLRTSQLDTATLQKSLFGTQAVSAEVEGRLAYSSFPRSYYSSVSDSASGGNTILASAQVFSTGTYSVPNVPVLFLGSALVRHNYNQGATTTENAAVATDYYYPSTSSKKIAKSRIESTVGTSNEGLSPIYSAPAFRLLTPAQYAAYSAAAGTMQAHAAVMPQDGSTPAAHVHASDSMFAFMPLKVGAKYAYSYHYPSTTVANSTVTFAEFLGSSTAESPLEFCVQLENSSGPVLATDIYTSDADCVLRMTLYPYTDSGATSFVYVDIPVTGISVNDSTKVVIDSSYRWYLEQCLPGKAYYGIHNIRALKDYVSAPNGASSITAKAILAVTRPIVSVAGDQGESTAALLSSPGDRNLVLGEFSLAITRPDTVITNGVAVNQEAGNTTAVEVYAGSNGAAAKVGSFDPNSLHLFIKADGSLAGRRALEAYNGVTYTTNIDAVLPPAVLSFISSGGKFSKVKVGESVIALLSTGATGKKLFLWGYNTYGHLDVPSTVDANFTANGYISNVKDFDFHAAHIAVILDNGKLYGWGCKASTVWRTSGSVIKAMDIGKNYSVALVERYDSSTDTTADFIEQYGNYSSAAPSGVTLKAPTVVWTLLSPEATQTIYAGKVLACGESHTVFLKSDGTVTCWGSNTYGQCTVPGGLSSIVAVDAGDNHTIALKSDGTVYVWGRNNYGQTSIPSGLNAKIISAGGDFCAAIRTSSSTDVSSVVGAITDEEVDNTVACWGRNDKNQCTVPTTEGLSYDPSAYRYRMRFWSVQCGWDHAIGIRKDDTSAKWARDHLELTRYIGSDLIKMPLKTSGGTSIYSCIRGLTWTPISGDTLKGTTSTGVVYTTGTGVSGLYYTTAVTVGSIKYRMKVDYYNQSSTTIQRSSNGGTTWTDLTFNVDQYDYAQNYTASTAYLLPNIQLAWNGIPSTPTWAPRLDTYDYYYTLDYLKAAQTTGEYVALDYSAADVASAATQDKLFVAWGNPIAYSASADKSDYQAYYGLNDLNTALPSDLVQAATSNQPSEKIYKSFSYVGLGKQLGTDLYTGGLGPSILDSYLASNIYLGPRSLQVADQANGLSVYNDTTGVTTNYGHPAVYISISGTPRFFNYPTAFSTSSTQIKSYVSPEANTNGAENTVIGFNNRAVYVEQFAYSLPAGYSLVANGSGSLPVGTANSDSGYHILWSGTVSGNSVKVVLTGAYYDDYSAGIRVPFDLSYANDPLPAAYLTALGLSVKHVRVIKHQLGVSASNRSIIPAKHVSLITAVPNSNIVANIQPIGLTIGANSYQRQGDVYSLTTAPGFNIGGIYAKYRSAGVLRKTTATVNSKYGQVFTPMGDNTLGQISLKLIGPFGLTPTQLSVNSYALSSSWLMDLGQANIGHTQTPALAYGYTQVSCGQFHTLAIDDSGAVSAWGLNYGINAPKTQFMLWDPFAFGGTPCFDTNGLTSSYVAGYFTTLAGEPSPAGSPGANFLLNRAVAAGYRPAAASNSADLGADNVFSYPNAPAEWITDCWGSYTTTGALLFDVNGFNDETVVLISQQTSSGPGFVAGLQNLNGNTRAYLTTSNGGTIYYSDAYVGQPKLVHVYYSNSGIGSGTYIKVRINGTDITWNSGAATQSPAIKAMSYYFHFDAVGDLSSLGVSLARQSMYRAYKPATANTRMFAGDTAFGGVYANEAESALVIRGSKIARPSSTDYSYSLDGVELPGQSNNPALPALDMEMPKGYGITKVSRIYFNSTTSTNTAAYKQVCVSYPFGAPSTSSYYPPFSIRALPNGTSQTSTELSTRENVVAIAAGTSCYFAIKNSSPSATQGTLVAWGSDQGDGVLTPPSGSTYVAVSARDRHAAALKADGSIVCWGNNAYGQCNPPSGTGYTAVACGDTFTAAINSAGKLVCWGSISTVPAPYSNMTFASVSCGKAHVVARTAAGYTENVPGGVFRVNAGDVMAFGDNSKGQCNIPGFSYGPNNAGLNAPAAAGGDFTVFESNTTGFKATEYRGAGATDARTVAFTDFRFNNPNFATTDLNFLTKLEGYVIHRAGALCPSILPPDHPWALNPPASEVTPSRDVIYETVQLGAGYTPVYSRTSNATNVPTAFRRGGTKKAKLIAAGRYPYYLQGGSRFAYGAGYGVIVGDDNQITVFGGDLLPTGCNINSYSPPAEALALRNLSGAGLNSEDVIQQLDTYRGQVFALKTSGDLAQWGYDDVSTTNDPEFYRVNTVKKQYFSVPDDSIKDVLPRLTATDYANIALSYVSGIPGYTDSWAVDVYLDRYFNGTKTTLRKFTATGKTPNYSIQSPVHFAETFLALDAWPGAATGLDSQYIMSVVPHGVYCTVNSASMFLLNLDSKTAGNVRVFNDGATMSSSLTTPADFFVVQKSGSNFASRPMLNLPSVDVLSTTDAASAITLNTNKSMTYPAYLKNSYGSSARLEYVDGPKTTGRVAGRIAYPATVTPAKMSADNWYSYTNLPSTVGNAISVWSNQISGGIALSQATAIYQPNVQTFNTSYKGAEFDTTTNQRDFMFGAASTAATSFTYFLVLKKPANTAATHCAFGKYVNSGGGQYRVQGVGFNAGKPVLFQGSLHDIASSSIGTANSIVCGYYGGTNYKGLRVNGTEVTSFTSTDTTFYVTPSQTAGYYLGANIAGANGGSAGNYHDSNDVYAEVVAFDRALTAAEIQIVEGYLNNKFGLSALPGGHPYQTSVYAADTLTQLYNEGLEEPNLLIESNRMAGTSGRGETWVGMFEIGLNHVTARTAAQGDNHAPILAEFDVLVNETIGLMTKPIVANVGIASATLTVDTNTKYISGSISASSSASATAILKIKTMTGTSSAKLNTVNAALYAKLGLNASIAGKLQFFGGTDCDGPYGCLEVSPFPPDLIIRRASLTSTVNTILGVNGTLSKYIISDYVPAVQTQVSLQSAMALRAGLVGNVFTGLQVGPANLKYLTTDIGLGFIRAKSTVVVCLPNLMVKGKSSAKKTTPVPYPPLPENLPDGGLGDLGGYLAGPA